MRTIAVIFFYAVFLILLAPVVLLFVIFGIRDPLISIGKWLFRVGGWILGLRIEVSGLDRFNSKGSYIFMSNHQSLLDGPLLIMLIPQTIRVILKKSVFKIPVLGWAMRHVEYVPVDRKGESRGKKSIERASDLIREKGYSFLVFAEGTRSLDGRLQRLRRGGFFLAVQSRAPIVPVTIRGSFEVMPKHHFYIKKGTIKVDFHSPVIVDDYNVSHISELIEKVKQAIQSAM